MNSEIKNILIVRTDRIGDVVLTLPLAEIVKKHYLNCKVSFLVRDYTKDILFDHPFIDDALIIKETKGAVNFFDNLKQISKNDYDACIVVNPTFRISLILFFCGIRKRIGTGYRWYSFLFNNKVFEHRKFAEKHELEFNISMLNKIGITEYIDEKKVHYNLQISPDALNQIDLILDDENIDKNKLLIIIHPGSGGSSIDLPISKFIELIKKFNAEDYQIIVTGNEKEKEICDQLVISNAVKNFAGKLSLAELIALISKSILFVSNSTGPIHIAAALKIFTVGFYPKILSCSKERWSPYTEKKLVYVPQIDCKNCTRKQCEELNCMETINMENVYMDIKEVLTQVNETELR